MDDRDFAGERAILIAGPTASGKSAVALALAERLGGVVINADSMQVYADLAVLTARPSADHMARAPHRLFGHVDAAETYSVGRWLGEVKTVLRETWSEGRVPVLVGGTGLYLQALMQGLSAIPTVPDEVRARVRAEAEGLSAQVLHDRLAARDPTMASRLRPSDPQRIVRALEVFEATGRSLATYQANREKAILPPARIAGVFLAPERATLHETIDRRFDRMLESGALEEVARLATRGLDASMPAMRALGVPPLISHVRGETSRQEASEEGKRLTRNYAKRQLTFARNKLSGLFWLSPDDATESMIDDWTRLMAERRVTLQSTLDVSISILTDDRT